MSYFDEVTRTLSDFHHWGHMDHRGVEYTVTYSYPDAEDEVRHERITRWNGLWYIMTLTHAHGRVDEDAAFPRILIDAAVVARMEPTFIGGVPTRTSVEVFYGMASAARTDSVLYGLDTIDGE